MHTKRLLRALPSLLLMCIIFYFSSQTADESTTGSNFFVRLLADFLQDLRGHSGNDTPLSDDFLSTLSFLIRKLAHTAEYALLGFCLLYFYADLNISRKMQFLCVLLTGFLYACSDELHQYFVPGRSCEFRDVLIDTNGVLLACLLKLLLCRIVKHCSVRGKS